MGYDTFFNVNITAPSKKEHDIVRKEIAEAAGRDPQNVDYGFEGHWYDSDKDLAAISARHPGVLIEVSGDGEESGDLWASRYRDGKSETVRFEGLPDFKEILTSREQEEISRKTSDAYNDALSALTEAALRRIRVLKDRITGEPDRLLSLERLNDDSPQIVIVDSVPLSHHEYVPLLVTAISADGKTVHTEQDSVELSDLLPKDLTRLFSLLESYVEDIDKGVIKRHWNGEEGVFELVFTLSTKVEDADKEVENIAHDRYFPKGYGVLDSKEL